MLIHHLTQSQLVSKSLCNIPTAGRTKYFQLYCNKCKKTKAFKITLDTCYLSAVY